MLKDLDPPPAEPITLAEAKTFLRVDHDDEDALIETLIRSARTQLEDTLGLAMIERAMVTAGPPLTRVHLPRWPVTLIHEVLSDGAESTDYHADLRARPSTVDVFAIEDIQITFSAGYGPDPSDVPTPLRQAMLLLVASGYERRDPDQTRLPLMVEALIQPYRGVRL